jgi:hypothetical protein
MADGGEHALDRARRPEVIPVLGGDVEAGEERVAIPRHAGDSLGILGTVRLDKGARGDDGTRTVGSPADLVQVGRDLRSGDFGMALRRFMTSCDQHRW